MGDAAMPKPGPGTARAARRPVSYPCWLLSAFPPTSSLSPSFPALSTPAPPLTPPHPPHSKPNKKIRKFAGYFCRFARLILSWIVFSF
jgi:hypothetical protein